MRHSLMHRTPARTHGPDSHPRPRHAGHRNTRTGIPPNMEFFWPSHHICARTYRTGIIPALAPTQGIIQRPHDVSARYMAHAIQDTRKADARTGRGPIGQQTSQYGIFEAHVRRGGSGQNRPYQGCRALSGVAACMEIGPAPFRIAPEKNAHIPMCADARHARILQRRYQTPGCLKIKRHDARRDFF